MALRLAERADAARRNGPAHRPVPPGAAASDLLARWRSQTPFDTGDWFRRRLAQDGLTEAEVRALIAVSAGSGADPATDAPWQRRLAAALAAGSGEDLPASRRRLPLTGTGFVQVVEPLIRRAWDEVERAGASLAGQLHAAPFDPAAAAALLWPGMEERLDWMLGRAMVLELHVARIAGALPGETPAERYRSFLRTAASPGWALAFFDDHPVLARLVVEAIDLWQEASCELLDRLCRDWPAILATFHPPADPGLLCAVSGGAGDVHRRGRAVRLLTFGSGFRLTYKPRPVSLDARFAELVAWLNGRGAPGLTAARVLERPGYGWMEFIAPRPCAESGELDRFYRRQGAFLALFHVLNTSDLHWENVIASGEHPIFIDLECLVSPDYGQFDAACYDSLAHFALNDSVLRIMMLPFFHGNSKQEVIDPSALGGDAGQLAVHETPFWENPGTDRMRLARRRDAAPPGHHRPVLGRRPADPLDFRPQLEEGFRALYRLLAEHRELLVAADSPLARLAGAEVRVVFRASQFYAFILSESYHPDLLRDAAERERHLDHLWFGIDHSRMPEVGLRVLPAEREDLWRGDLPAFTTLAESRHIWDSAGRCLPGLLRRSALEMVSARLGGLGEEDLARQLWIIRASFTALAVDQDVEPPAVAEIRLPRSAVGREGLAAAAAAISARLHQTALAKDGSASWLGLAKTRSRGWWLRPLDADLYAGLPGVALYLGFAGEILDRPQDTRLARQALASLDRLLERPHRVPFVGGFDGWGGILHTWLQLGRLWRDDGLVERAGGALRRISELAGQDEDLDVIRGAAGAIVPLLALHRQTGSAAALQLARRLGERIADAARPFRGGLCWQTASFPVHPLTGFSHGTAGFAWALTELHAATGEERFRRTAASALAFEEQFFSAEQGNWMDLRPCRDGLGTSDYRRDATYSVSWCHGACGIGLSRLRMLGWLDQLDHLDLGRARLLASIRIAAGKTLRGGFGSNHSLCHGDLGNLLFLLEASRQLPGEGWDAAVEERTGHVLASLSAHGPRCGVPFAVETPGLMEGLAGIGYGLLRLAAPREVPCVLLLEPGQAAQAEAYSHAPGGAGAAGAAVP